MSPGAPRNYAELVHRAGPVVWTLVSLLGAAGCGDREPVTLAVDLTTDLEPGAEFDVVRVRLASTRDPETAIRQTSTDVASGRDLTGGRRVAVFEDLAPGDYGVEVDLVTLDGTFVVGRRIAVTARSSLVVTALITRDCRSIECPGPGDPPNATTCRAGGCVDPRCRPEDPEYCTEDACVRDTDCEAEEGRRRVCISGVCLFPPEMDAGTDAGMDAGAGTYSWVVGDCGECSVSCGGGTCRRDVYCQREEDGERVADSFCSDPRPADEEACNTEPCCSTDSMMADRRCAETTDDIVWWTFPEGHYGSDTGSEADREMCRQDCTERAEANGLDDWCCDLSEDSTTGTSWNCALHSTPTTESYNHPDSNGSFAGLGRCR